MIIIFIFFLILFILFFQNIDNFENNYNFTVISNTCVGYLILQKYNIKYNNPFIGTLFVDDYDYIKLSNNFMEYINYSPLLYIPTDNKKNKYTEQTNNKYYIHDLVNVPYPILKLNDIEIHCVHENNNEEALNKFNKRINRLRELIKNNHKIFITMSFSQFLNKHDNYEILIDQFLEKSNNIIKLFIGPICNFNINCDKTAIY